MTALALILVAVAAFARAEPAIGPQRPPRPPRPPRGHPHVADPVLLLELVAAALRAGVAIPRALEAAGTAWESPALARAGRLLLLGATWEEAWEGVPHRVLARALEPAWRDGASPLPLLERAVAVAIARRDRSARVSAGRLGVRLVLPLGLCHLPAFIAIGVVPVLLSTGVELLGG